MSIDKFGRHSSSQLYLEPGVSLRFANSHFLRRDGSNLADPSDPEHAVNKRYVDSQKQMIVIVAHAEGPLRANQYWSLSGALPRGSVCLPYSGRIVKIGIFYSYRRLVDDPTLFPDQFCLATMIVSGNSAINITAPVEMFETGLTTSITTSFRFGENASIYFVTKEDSPFIMYATLTIFIELVPS